MLPRFLMLRNSPMLLKKPYLSDLCMGDSSSSCRRHGRKQNCLRLLSSCVRRLPRSVSSSFQSAPETPSSSAVNNRVTHVLFYLP
ncbi:hypothetical protein L596_005784 [Steinernema carpocapsae]|uniref:Uncharacterized protein n=1 Tax=Steinernema carpocapsae TaxID=34508 RepID=A0A4U8V1D1_STECR|nr:hypothetical protein L596_005784 [Steinernema carpocapsae]